MSLSKMKCWYSNHCLHLLVFQLFFYSEVNLSLSPPSLQQWKSSTYLVFRLVQFVISDRGEEGGALLYSTFLSKSFKYFLVDSLKQENIHLKYLISSKAWKDRIDSSVVQHLTSDHNIKGLNYNNKTCCLNRVRFLSNLFMSKWCL